MSATSYTRSGTLFLLAAFTLTGCSQHFYTPTNQQVLNFTEKGDLVVGGVTDFNECLGGSAGYAFTNHIAMSSAFNFFEHIESNDVNGPPRYQYNSYMWDNELITFHKIDIRKGSVIPAINFGYGFGEIGRNNKDYGINIKRMYAQPSIGYRGTWFEIAGSLRISSVKYDIREGEWTSPDGIQTVEDTFDTPRDGRQYIFMEPAITIGCGYKGVKLRFQRSWAAHNSEDQFEYITDNLTISLSLGFNAIRCFNKN